jgi:hypothetical protein
MCNEEIEKIYRVVRMRFAHDVKELMMEFPELIFTPYSKAFWEFDTAVHVASPKVKGHSLILSNNSVVRYLDALYKVREYDPTNPNPNKWFDLISCMRDCVREHANPIGKDFDWLFDVTMRSLEKESQRIIWRGTYDRRCREFAGDYSVDQMDLVQAVSRCPKILAMSGPLRREILTDFVNDCLAIDKELYGHSYDYTIA